MQPIYLDYNGTTPIHPKIRQALTEVFMTSNKDNEFISQCFGNPSSTHYYGVEAKMAVNQARKQIASLFNCDQQEIIFTSGGSESNNMAIQGTIVQALQDGIQEPHVITTSFEHPSVENVLTVAKKLFNTRVSKLTVDQYGFINLQQLQEQLTKTTCLVTIMLANNEVGTINAMQPIYEVIQKFNNQNNVHVVLHMDCSQAVGKVPIDAQFADLITVAGHKFYAPKGIGCLYIRKGIKLFKLSEGAGQEQNIRPGTENVFYIKALGMAAEFSEKELKRRMEEHSALVEILYSNLKDLNHKVNGYAEVLLKRNQFSSHFQDQALCLPNTLNISFPGIPNSSILSALNQSVCVSAGAACHSDHVTVSAVLKAMGITDEVGMGTLRITVGDGVTKEQCRTAGQMIKEVVMQYQGIPQQIAQPAHHEEKPVETSQITISQASKLQQSKIEEPALSKPTKQNLLNFTQGLGCACKLRPQLLDRVLKGINFGKDQNLTIDASTNDDAAVYMLNGSPVVLTTDFFSPVIDDAYLYGRIASANALSDVYAMNSRPLFALAVCGFNSSRMTEETMHQIMQGAVDKCAECKIVIAGGHTIESVEPFFGLVCAGSCEPKLIRRNVIRLGENPIYLVMTKRLGTGMAISAFKKGILQKQMYFEQLYQDVVENMQALNNSIEKLTNFDTLNALTDVTGFGLFGHLSEMLVDLSCEIFFKSVPVLTNIHTLYKDFGEQIANAQNNIEYVKQRGIEIKCEDKYMRDILGDPTTSGGLLYAVEGAENAQRAAKDVGGTVIGRVYRGEGVKEIVVYDETFRDVRQRQVGLYRE